MRELLTHLVQISQFQKRLCDLYKETNVFVDVGSHLLFNAPPSIKYTVK